MIKRLPATTQTLYAELLERAIHFEAEDVLGPAGSGSFVKKQVKGKDYWYLQKSEGCRKRQLYLGPDGGVLQDWMARVRETRASVKDQVAGLVRLSGMLISGGVAAEDSGIVKVLEILREAEVFRLGGVLIGTVAYRALGTALGVSLGSSAVRTQDIDIAQEPSLAVGLTPNREQGNVAERLLGSGEGILAIPALDPRTPSTSFSVRSRDLRVDFLVPARGKQTESAVFVPAFGLSAFPLRFLEYLVDAPIQAVVVGSRPVLVNIPRPGRFAFHKIYTSRGRSAAFQTKAAKDLRQASTLIEILLEDRPEDLSSAWDALRSYPKVRVRVTEAIDLLEKPIAAKLHDLIREG